MIERGTADHDRTPSEASTDEEPDILLVEDNPGDVRLLREAMDAVGIPHRLHVTSNGTEALEFVYRQNEFADAPRPDLILLDLNLPQTDGHEVLNELKSDSEHARIPIIVLSSSEDDEDVRRAYAAGANAYLTKPVDPDTLIDRLRLIELFWLSNVRLPD